MQRRNFLTASAAFAILPKMLSAQEPQKQAASMIIPKKLSKGDTIGLIAPATAVPDPEQTQKAIEALNYFGLKIRFGDSFANQEGYLTKSIDVRVNDIHGMFKDNEVKAVFCIRGGYGSIRLLDRIDYDLIRKNPKIFLGYSDITALHLAINKLSGLVTFHGPVMLSDFTSYTANYFKKAMFEDKPIGLVSNPETKSNFRLVHPVRTVASGMAKGKLIGGNLTLISSLMGTPYEIDTKGKILFIEDTGEQPYRIDRMLSQLHLANKLKVAAGIIFGECVDCNYDGLKPSRIWDYSLGEIVDNFLANLNIPVLSGLVVGHTSDQITLPLGINAELDADRGTLNITETATN